MSTELGSGSIKKDPLEYKKITTFFVPLDFRNLVALKRKEGKVKNLSKLIRLLVRYAADHKDNIGPIPSYPDKVSLIQTNIAIRDMMLLDEFSKRFNVSRSDVVIYLLEKYFNGEIEVSE
ncbi:hypothetical protein D9Q81_00390 [Candidatus Korarchaeum cryptofilum]|jgi:hypothetical protein|uniref:Uncharacterized protein n=1 Tax=Candidatus Korarchaeum cryptofilum TaxID=498846 RepID=A0A3R9QS22_9CREN|nr:hypothetical protein [Candidatus Korarchaeum cryptofilum]RSN70771.1 hypothetical protein D9Q81_00390 [Candidatus Korarchaeum cryptofilum]